MLIISRRFFSKLCFVTCMGKYMLHASKLKYFKKKSNRTRYYQHIEETKKQSQHKFLRSPCTSLSNFWGSFPVKWEPSITSLAHSWHFLVSSTVNIFSGFWVTLWLNKADLSFRMDSSLRVLDISWRPFPSERVLDKSWRAFRPWRLGFTDGFSGLALLPEVERYLMLSGRISGSSSSSFSSSGKLATS